MLNYIDALIIRSNNHNVFSLFNGQVRAIFRIDSEIVIIIKNFANNFYISRRMFCQTI